MKKKILIIVSSAIIFTILIIINKTYQKKLDQNIKKVSWLRKNVSITKNYHIGSNILSVNKTDKINIYSDAYRKVIDEKISELTSKDYSVNNPLMIYNAYGTNTNSLNIYFYTNDYVKVSYSIMVDNYSNFEETLNNEYSKEHKYQLIGFVMGFKNTLKVTLENENGSKNSYTFELDFSNYSNNTNNKLKVTKKNNLELSNGLFAILGDSREDCDYIHLVDNDGNIRSEIPIIGYRAVNLLFNDDKMYFSISETKMAEVNRLGKITNIYKLGKYKLHHDYTFDTNKENLLILASDTTKESCEDSIIKLNLKTGKITDVFYLEEVLPDIRNNAYYNKDEVSDKVESVGVDWMHINTINYFDGDTVIISSRETSSIIKIKNIFKNPIIEYILGDKSFWNNFEESKYLYTKIGDFTISGGQHTVTYIPTDDDGIYYLSMFNNNIGISTTQPNFNWKKIGLEYSSPKDNGISYYYKYKVDENNKTFELVEKFAVPYSAYMGSSQEYENNIIIDSAQKCIFYEGSNTGNIKATYKFECKSSIYRVFKYNFNKYWFNI